MLTLEAIRQRPVFTVAERNYRWDDVIAAAEDRGDWAPIVELARRGAAGANRAETAPPEEAKAANRFRAQRGFHSGDEFQAWLTHWGLDVDLWMGWIRRSLWRELWPEQTQPAEPDWQWVWVEAVCGGALPTLARQLAERAATANDDDDGAHARFCAAATNPGAVARVFEHHHLDWLRVDARCLAHPNLDAAREALLCVREDGLDLAEVATRAGTAVETKSWYLDAAPPELRPSLLSAKPGDLVGPLAVGEQHWLVEVLDKVAPSPDDADLLEKATAIAIRVALDAAVSARVSWHEHL